MLPELDGFIFHRYMILDRENATIINKISDYGIPLYKNEISLLNKYIP